MDKCRRPLSHVHDNLERETRTHTRTPVRVRKCIYLHGAGVHTTTSSSGGRRAGWTLANKTRTPAWTLQPGAKLGHTS
eukprot:6461583-Amphidinium_carterae.1